MTEFNCLESIQIEIQAVISDTKLATIAGFTLDDEQFMYGSNPKKIEFAVTIFVIDLKCKTEKLYLRFPTVQDATDFVRFYLFTALPYMSPDKGYETMVEEIISQAFSLHGVWLDLPQKKWSSTKIIQG